MQVEINEHTVHLLESQASAHGCTVEEHIDHVLTRYAAASMHRAEAAEPFQIKTYEDAVAWILSQNPNIANQSHTQTDWHALKSEGRRF